MSGKVPRTYECNICGKAITVPHPWGPNMSAHKRTCRKEKEAKKAEQLNTLAETGRNAKKTKKQLEEIIFTRIQEMISRTRKIIEEFEIIPRPIEFIVPNPFYFEDLDEGNGYEQELLEDLAPVDIPIYIPEPAIQPSVTLPSEPITLEGVPSVKGTPEEIEPSGNLTQVGFDFGKGEEINLVKNLTKFDTIREAFLSAEKFDALKDLYDLFTLSYIQTFGGYGLTEHKKEVLVKTMMKIRKTFEFLKGPHRANKQYKMLARYSETTLYNTLHGLVLASSMDTLSQREADKVEVAKILAEATIATEKEKAELQDIVKRFTKTEEN